MILICTAGCDQATKHIARTELGSVSSTPGSSHFIQLTLAENSGAFLSLGASLSATLRRLILTAGVSVGLALLLAYLIRAPGLQWLSFIGLALVWAGGASNLIDRIARHGLVTDFMIIRIGPIHTGIFNLADMAVAAGLVMLLASVKENLKLKREKG